MYLSQCIPSKPTRVSKYTGKEKEIRSKYIGRITLYMNRFPVYDYEFDELSTRELRREAIRTLLMNHYPTTYSSECKKINCKLCSYISKHGKPYYENSKIVNEVSLNCELNILDKNMI